MINPSEQGIPRGQEVLRFHYKDQDVTLPVVHSTFQLKQAVVTRITPGLHDARVAAQSGDQVGIAFTPYHYVTDSLVFQSPEAANALIKHMKAAGLPIRDDILENPVILDPVSPTRHDLIARMKEKGDHYFPLKYLQGATFVVGPLTTKPLPEDEDFITADMERDLASLHTNASIAIHGETILQDYNLPEGRDRMLLKEIVDYLQQAFHPFALK